MSIEIIPRVVEALHSREASLRASRECNASTTRGIISILIVLVGSSYIIFFVGFFQNIVRHFIYIYTYIHRHNRLVIFRGKLCNVERGYWQNTIF